MWDTRQSSSSPSLRIITSFVVQRWMIAKKIKRVRDGFQRIVDLVGDDPATLPIAASLSVLRRASSAFNWAVMSRLISRIAFPSALKPFGMRQLLRGRRGSLGEVPVPFTGLRECSSNLSIPLGNWSGESGESVCPKPPHAASHRVPLHRNSRIEGFRSCLEQ